MLTFMDNSRKDVIDTMDSHVDRKQETKEDLICKHYHSLNNMEAVSCESCWSPCPGQIRGMDTEAYLCSKFLNQQGLSQTHS